MFTNRKKLFNKESSINAILHIIQSFGKVDIHKICKILYFADQQHLAKYGRQITGDTYIHMPYGPVPSNIEDIFKALRGDSFFADKVDDLKDVIVFVNRYTVTSSQNPDMDELSESDVECLDAAIAKCRPYDIAGLTEMSHGLAWSLSGDGEEIGLGNILREVGESEDYIDFIQKKRHTQLSFLADGSAAVITQQHF